MVSHLSEGFFKERPYVILIRSFHASWGGADACLSRIHDLLDQGSDLKIFFIGPGVAHLFLYTSGLPFALSGVGMVGSKLRCSVCRTSWLRWSPQGDVSTAQEITMTSASQIFLEILQAKKVFQF